MHQLMFIETYPLNVSAGSCGNGVNVGLDLGIVRFFVCFAVFPVLKKIDGAGYDHRYRHDSNDGIDRMDFMVCCFHLCFVLQIAAAVKDMVINAERVGLRPYEVVPRLLIEIVGIEQVCEQR